jgi:hypothetical protein
VIVAAGGAVTECDRGDCGTLGNFTYEDSWPLVPLVFLVVAVLPAWAAARRVRRR